MVKVIIHKSGRFAFDGINIEDVEKGVFDIPDKKAVVICQTHWADYDTNKASPKPVVKEDHENGPSQEIDWEFISALVEDGDKLGLDEYAETFGVKLKRNKTIENMLKDFKESV